MVQKREKKTLWNWVWWVQFCGSTLAIWLISALLGHSWAGDWGGWRSWPLWPCSELWCSVAVWYIQASVRPTETQSENSYGQKQPWIWKAEMKYSHSIVMQKWGDCEQFQRKKKIRRESRFALLCRSGRSPKGLTNRAQIGWSDWVHVLQFKRWIGAFRWMRRDPGMPIWSSREEDGERFLMSYILMGNFKQM